MGPSPEFLSGDWSCRACGDHQFSRNSCCRQCQTPRDERPDVSKSDLVNVIKTGQTQSADWHRSWTEYLREGSHQDPKKHNLHVLIEFLHDTIPAYADELWLQRFRKILARMPKSKVEEVDDSVVTDEELDAFYKKWNLRKDARKLLKSLSPRKQAGILHGFMPFDTSRDVNGLFLKFAQSRLGWPAGEDVHSETDKQNNPVSEVNKTSGVGSRVVLLRTTTSSACGSVFTVTRASSDGLPWYSADGKFFKVADQGIWWDWDSVGTDVRISDEERGQRIGTEVICLPDNPGNKMIVGEKHKIIDVMKNGRYWLAESGLHFKPCVRGAWWQWVDDLQNADPSELRISDEERGQRIGTEVICLRENIGNKMIVGEKHKIVDVMKNGCYWLAESGLHFKPCVRGTWWQWVDDLQNADPSELRITDEELGQRIGTEVICLRENIGNKMIVGGKHKIVDVMKNGCYWLAESGLHFKPCVRGTWWQWVDDLPNADPSELRISDSDQALRVGTEVRFLRNCPQREIKHGDTFTVVGVTNDGCAWWTKESIYFKPSLCGLWWDWVEDDNARILREAQTIPEAKARIGQQVRILETDKRIGLVKDELHTIAGIRMEPEAWTTYSPLYCRFDCQGWLWNWVEALPYKFVRALQDSKVNKSDRYKTAKYKKGEVYEVKCYANKDWQLVAEGNRYFFMGRDEDVVWEGLKDKNSDVPSKPKVVPVTSKPNMFRAIPTTRWKPRLETVGEAQKNDCEDNGIDETDESCINTAGIGEDGVGVICKDNGMDETDESCINTAGIGEDGVGVICKDNGIDETDESCINTAGIGEDGVGVIFKDNGIDETDESCINTAGTSECGIGTNCTSTRAIDESCPPLPYVHPATSEPMKAEGRELAQQGVKLRSSDLGAPPAAGAQQGAELRCADMGALPDVQPPHEIGKKEGFSVKPIAAYKRVKRCRPISLHVEKALNSIQFHRNAVAEFQAAACAAEIAWGALNDAVRVVSMYTTRGEDIIGAKLQRETCMMEFISAVELLERQRSASTTSTDSYEGEEEDIELALVLLGLFDDMHDPGWISSWSRDRLAAVQELDLAVAAVQTQLARQSQAFSGLDSDEEPEPDWDRVHCAIKMEESLIFPCNVEVYDLTCVQRAAEWIERECRMDRSRISNDVMTKLMLERMDEVVQCTKSVQDMGMLPKFQKEIDKLKVKRKKVEFRLEAAYLDSEDSDASGADPATLKEEIEKFRVKMQQKEKERFRTLAQLWKAKSGFFPEIELPASDICKELAPLMCEGRTLAMYDIINKQHDLRIMRVRFAGHEYALKSFDLPQAMLEEAKFQHRMRHASIVPVTAIFTCQDPNGTGVPWSYIEMPFYEHSMASLEQISSETALRLAGGVLAAVDHLHRENVAHGDLKPQNFLMSEGIPRLCDFGLSRKTADRTMATITRTRNMRAGGGTYGFMAPELFGCNGATLTKACDMFSVGKILEWIVARTTDQHNVEHLEQCARLLTDPYPDNRPTVATCISDFVCVERTIVPCTWETRDGGSLSHLVEVTDVEERRFCENLAFLQEMERILLRKSSRVPAGMVKPGCILQPDAGEIYMLHGTTQSNLTSILNNGMDVAKSNLRGWYGCGFYGASQSCKAFQYCDRPHIHASKNPPIEGEEYKLIICRFLLGAAQETDDILANARHNLVRKPADGFDSIVARPGRKKLMNGSATSQFHWEAVIFNNQQMYPEYVVSFTVPNA